MRCGDTGVIFRRTGCARACFVNLLEIVVPARTSRPFVTASVGGAIFNAVCAILPRSHFE